MAGATAKRKGRSRTGPPVRDVPELDVPSGREISVARMAEGHRLIDEARRVDLDLLESAHASASSAQRQLEADHEVFGRYRIPFDPVFDTLRVQMGAATKGLEHAIKVLTRRMENDTQLVRPRGTRPAGKE